MNLIAPVRPPHAPRAHALRRALPLFAAALALVSGCYMLSPRTKVGRLAPKLTIDRWFQAPTNADPSWLALRGKVVVINFWEPWKDSASNELPHLNALADQFAGDPNVQFIHVTSSDSTATLTTFTDITPIRGWIAMDPDLTVLHAYGVHEYPDTWVVSPEGRVVAITRPKFVTADVIHAVMEGRTKIPVAEGFID